MRVGVVTPRHPASVGGGFTFHVTVLEALSRATTGHEFTLLDLGTTDTQGWRHGELPVVNVPAMFPSYDASSSPASLTELAAVNLGLDVVWYLDPPADVLSVPVFATVLDLAHRQHPFFPELSTEDWIWSEREHHYERVLPRAARILVGTQIGKDETIRCYGVNPASVIVNPFPTPVLAGADEPLMDDKVMSRHGLSPEFLFYPAQFWAHKNHVNLLLALKRLETAHGLTPDLVLTGSDKGNLDYVQKTADDLGVRHRVHFLGFVPNGDVATFYRQAAALVFCSFLGPDNLPPLEAFSMGCPVVASRVEGAEEQMGSVAAAFFDPAQPNEMAKMIARVLTEPRYRKKLIKNGYKIAARRTPEKYVQVVLAALDDFEPWRRSWPASTTR